MAATRRCNMCGTDFNGRADAVYCSSACRQKAHRARMADHLAKLACPLPEPCSVGEDAPLALAGGRQVRQRLLTRGAGSSRVFDDVVDDLARALHDGARQRLVTLALRLRQAEASIPDELTDTRAQLFGVVSGLADVSADLQEIACGIHPAIVSRGGLGPALKTLARRCPVPVDVDFAIDNRFADQVEVATYCVVAAALINAGTHARATVVTVSARIVNDQLCVEIRDDGVGAADATNGSGLSELKDRIEALGGKVDVVSPIESGTSLRIVGPVVPPEAAQRRSPTSSAPACGGGLP